MNQNEGILSFDCIRKEKKRLYLIGCAFFLQNTNTFKCKILQLFQRLRRNKLIKNFASLKTYHRGRYPDSQLP